ncbi:NUDIX domain-containing protein [Solihabitans fulvus]|uniref:NUDIX domain-containing protein n=1 Tax=Solihabitans fulvus TaxID=1892852 RepID=A0A5B2XQG7_9PSEU|nr:NUDIX domain-containing protein [Solihabitans fulvus]KAA2266178.1 NUDIX domain-containing protein [Solihabitans fulvus]
MTENRRHSVSVAGIVINDADQILVIRRRDNGQWEPPGGILEISETFEDGVRREVFEETGVKVEVERLTGVYKNMNRAIVALVFRCRPTDTQAEESLPTAATDEAREVRWMSLAEIREAMAPAYAIRVADAFEPGTRTRAHDGVSLI